MRLTIEGIDSFQNLIDELNELDSVEGMNRRIQRLFPGAKASVSRDAETKEFVIEGLIQEQSERLTSFE